MGDFVRGKDSLEEFAAILLSTVGYFGMGWIVYGNLLWPNFMFHALQVSSFSVHMLFFSFLWDTNVESWHKICSASHKQSVI